MPEHLTLFRQNAPLVVRTPPTPPQLFALTPAYRKR